VNGNANYLRINRVATAADISKNGAGIKKTSGFDIH